MICPLTAVFGRSAIGLNAVNLPELQLPYGADRFVSDNRLPGVQYIAPRLDILACSVVLRVPALREIVNQLLLVLGRDESGTVLRELLLRHKRVEELPGEVLDADLDCAMSNDIVAVGILRQPAAINRRLLPTLRVAERHIKDGHPTVLPLVGFGAGNFRRVVRDKSVEERLDKIHPLAAVLVDNLGDFLFVGLTYSDFCRGFREFSGFEE